MGRYAEIAKKAKDLTNNQLRDEIATSSDYRAQSIDKLFPKLPDKQQFVELMAAVEKRTSEQEKLNYLAENSEKYGRVILRVLQGIL